MKKIKNYCRAFFTDTEEGENGAELFEIVLGIAMVAILAAVVYGIIAIVTSKMDETSEEIKDLGSDTSSAQTTTAEQEQNNGEIIIEDDAS